MSWKNAGMFVDRKILRRLRLVAWIGFLLVAAAVAIAAISHWPSDHQSLSRHRQITPLDTPGGRRLGLAVCLLVESVVLIVLSYCAGAA